MYFITIKLVASFCPLPMGYHELLPFPLAVTEPDTQVHRFAVGPQGKPFLKSHCLFLSMLIENNTQNSTARDQQRNEAGAPGLIPFWTVNCKSGQPFTSASSHFFFI